MGGGEDLFVPDEDYILYTVISSFADQGLVIKWLYVVTELL